MIRDTFDFMNDHSLSKSDDNDPPSRRKFQSKDKLDLDLVFHAKTDKAVLVSPDGSNARTVWLPTVGFDPVDYKFTGKLAMAELRDGRKVQLEIVTVTLSERLAMQKGLV